MATVEVRRHAERAGPTEAGSALSAAGRAMAERLARSAPAYAVVAASPLPRARETATIVGGRLDLADPALLPDLSQIVQVRTIEEYVPLLADGERELALADEQAGAWARIAATADGRRSGATHATALVVTHGGVIELAALRIAKAIGKDLRGDAFSYCEGVRVRYEDGKPLTIELLRV